MKRFLESCCTSLEQALFAQEHGARRIELCEQLEVGGVTPSRELLAAVLGAVTIPVNVLVRPRGGDFRFGEEEIQQMISDIRHCGSCGVHGVVIGALDSAGNIDMPAMTRMISEARNCGLSITFHRAFDVCSDPLTAFGQIMELGCDRLLTSGHEPDAYAGRFLIAELVRRSAGRIIVMAGCGVRPSNIEAIAEASAAPEYHASFSFFEQNPGSGCKK